MGLHGVRHLVGTGLGVGVAHGLSLSRLAIAKVPLVVCDGVVGRRAGRAGELRGAALAHGGVSEVTRGQGIHGHGLCDLAGAVSAR